MPTLTPSSEDINIYEIAMMYQPDLEQKAESQLLSDAEGLITEAKGVVLFRDPWSRRGLAYQIKGFSEAKFVMYYVEVPPTNVRELDKQLRLQKGILRHMIVIPPPKYEAVSFEEKYQEWLKTRETASDMKRRKQEEKVQHAVATHAKRVTKRPAKEEKAPAKPIALEELTQQLDKLISDDDLKL